jgi:hypothetical protein
MTEEKCTKKQKHLHVMVDESLHDALIEMSSGYRGELSKIVRMVLEDFVKKARQTPAEEALRPEVPIGKTS